MSNLRSDGKTGRPIPKRTAPGSRWRLADPQENRNDYTTIQKPKGQRVMTGNPEFDREPDEDFFCFHSESSRYVGDVADANRTTLIRNPVCGDQLGLTALVTPDRHVAAIRFRWSGCLLSKAAASILCERVEGAFLDELGRLSDADIIRSVRISVTPRRYSCVLLAHRGLLDMFGIDLAQPETPRSDSNPSIPNAHRR